MSRYGASYSKGRAEQHELQCCFDQNVSDDFLVTMNFQERLNKISYHLANI